MFLELQYIRIIVDGAPRLRVALVGMHYLFSFGLDFLAPNICVNCFMLLLPKSHPSVNIAKARFGGLPLSPKNAVLVIFVYLRGSY